jgi:hypothetical protein
MHGRSAALVFSEPGNPASELLEMRCSRCRQTKPVSQFPASCAVYRRGTCRDCNALSAREKRSQPVARKLESARVRYRHLGGVTVRDVAALYEQFGLDVDNDDHVRHTCVSKVNEEEPLGIGNVTLKWRVCREPLARHGAAAASGRTGMQC